MKELILGLLSCCCLPLTAQTFEDYFENKTLRVDYLFTGDANKQEVFLDELCSTPEWAGRRHNWTSCP